MTGPIGWLVVQRNIAGSVQVAGTPEVWVTATLHTLSQHLVGMHTAAYPIDSLRGALTMAITKPAPGAPRQPPSVVMAPVELVSPVRAVLHEAGIAASVDEVVPPDWAEYVLTDLTAYLAGRPQLPY